MRVQDHVSAIEDALDDFADDVSVPLSEYAEAMEALASTIRDRSRAAYEDLRNQ